MPKAILSFKLPEEQAELQAAQNGSYWHGVVQEFDNYLRARLKHEDLTKDVHDALYSARTKLYDLADAAPIWD